MAGDRSFTIVRASVKLPEGASTRYESSSPYSAASKAARRLYTEVEKSSKKVPKEIRFTLRETTASGTSKEFTYVAVKRKLDVPKVVKIGDTTITYEYQYNVRSCLTGK